MAVKRNYRINLRNYGNSPAIMVSQYDENYDLVFEVYDGVVPATGLNAYTVKLVGRQPGDDPALKYEFTGTVSGIANNILSFTIDTTMTGRAGKGTAEIVILDTTNDVKFASFNLPVYVEKAAVPDDAIDADVERAQEIAEEVQEIVDTAAAEVKGEAEAWAVGERDGEPVPSTDPTYHNNAKYYSEVAQDIADSIGIDATLSISGKAADAKKTGDEISSLKEDFEDVSIIALSNSDRITNTVNTVIGEKQGVNSSSYTFKDNIGNNKLSNMKLLVSGTQSGSGVPFTDNVRPLSQPSSVSVSNTDGTSENTDTVDLSQIASEAYSGYLYPFEGKYVCTVKKIKLDGTNLSISFVDSSRGFCVFNAELDLPSSIYTGSNYVLLCDKLQSISTNATWDNYSQFVSVSYENNRAQLVLKPGVPISSKEDVNLWLSTNKPEIAYTIVTPLEYIVNSIDVSTYYGLNTVSVSNGSIVDIQAFNSDIIIGCDQFLQNGIFDYMAFANMTDIGKTYSSHGIDFTINNDGSINIDGTSDDIATLSIVRRKINKNAILYVDMNGSDIPLQIYINNKSNSTIKQATFYQNGQFGVPNDDDVDNIYIRIRIPSGTTINNQTVTYSVINMPTTDKLNVLVFGNSFSYSTLSYIPSLIAEINPKLDLTFGILYDSGMQFTGHISYFNNNTPYAQYCEYKTYKQSWTKTNNTITGKNALDRNVWDCIILQQSAEHMDDYDNLEVFADLISGYLKYPVEYLFNMPQARHANDKSWLPRHYDDPTGEERSNHHFADIADYAERTLDGAIISDVLPCGTAVQNARTVTAFKTIGDDGYLSKDALGHLQNGLGILISGYAGAYKLLEIVRKKPKLYGAQLNPTNLWVSDVNPPSSVHGDCVGVSSSNKLIGMKCAMMAIKKPFELTDCSNI